MMQVLDDEGSAGASNKASMIGCGGRYGLGGCKAGEPDGRVEARERTRAAGYRAGHDGLSPLVVIRRHIGAYLGKGQGIMDRSSTAAVWAMKIFHSVIGETDKNRAADGQAAMA